MKRLTQKQFDKLLDNGPRQAAVKGGPDELDFYPVVKLLDPTGAAICLFTEIEPDDHSVAWGLRDLGMGSPEFGTVSLTELASIRRSFGLGIERDLHFKADKPVSAYSEEADRLGRIQA